MIDTLSNNFVFNGPDHSKGSVFMIDLSNPDEIFKRLSVGVGNSDHAYHLPSIATVGTDSYPESRTVVLRHVDAAMRAIHVYADVRSPKVSQVQADPRVTVLFYDPVSRLQVRCRASVKTHIEDDIAHAAWVALPETSKAMYAALAAPSQIVSVHPSMPIPSEIADPVAFRHFTVLACYVTELDVLELNREQNRRSLLRWEDGKWREIKVAC